MNLQKILLIAVIPLLLNGCSTFKDIKNANIGTEFTQSAKGYRNLLRWQEFDTAAIAFVDEPLRDEFQKRIEALKDVKMADYRVKSLECMPEKGEATVKVEFDYYTPPSMKLKTAEDVQKWIYREGNGKKQWRLTTLLPEFARK